MALKLHLKPQEKIIIGGAVISSGARSIEFLVENNVPILRQKDILTEGDANTPCKRLYFTLQLMYIDQPSLLQYDAAYRGLAGEICALVPSTAPFIDEIASMVGLRNYYQALKSARKLVEYESELVEKACTAVSRK